MRRVVGFLLVVSALCGVGVFYATYRSVQHSVEVDPTVECAEAAGCPTPTP